VTSGSTSPLYTFLLALGFFVTSNEMVLSYVLGVGFFLLAGGFLLRIAELHFGARRPLAMAAPLLFLLQPRLIWGALSGMETTLFILLLLSTYFYYATRRPVHLGVSAGMLLWTRPEGFLFLAILAVDLVVGRRAGGLAGSVAAGGSTPARRKRSGSVLSRGPWWRTPFLIAAALAALYVIFNETLSGSLLPNTYAAKLKYYQPRPGYPADVFRFLASGHMAVLGACALVGALVTLARVLSRRPAAALVSLLWLTSMFFVYWKKLPYLYQQGRYLMPVLPFFILLALHGLQAAIAAAGRLQRVPARSGGAANAARRTLALPESQAPARAGPQAIRVLEPLLLLVPLVQVAVAAWHGKEVYREYCKYMSDRQVRTARWIAANLPSTAVVATHDIGAIAFYSGRKIVDMVGLVSPDMVQSIGRSKRLEELLAAHGATHVAILRGWFTIDNVAPVFQTDVKRPEPMEVFPFLRGRTHIVDAQADAMLAAAQQDLDAGNATRAALILERAESVDSRSATIRFRLAQAYIRTEKHDRAEAELKAALQLYPELLDARMALAQTALKLNRPTDAVAILNALLAENPKFAAAYRMLSEIHATVLQDTVRAAEYKRRYDALVGRPSDNR
jgi:tetratricopeptide (TPR) repeat protein